MTILLNNIPAELKKKQQWVGWTMLNERKVPMCPMTGRAGKSSDPSTWGTFAQAVEAYKAKRWHGIGFVFDKDYVGVDLDDCVDNMQINAYAKGVLAKHNSYTEFSPSGTGIHIIAKGDIPRALKTDEIEIYNTGRYFTITGRVVKGRKLIKPVDLSGFFGHLTDNQQTTSERLRNLKPGNVDNTLTSLAGSLFRKGFSYQEVYLFLKEKANQAGHDDSALHRVCASVQRYHPQGETYGFGQEQEEHKQVEVFTPATHTQEFLNRMHGKGEAATGLPTGFPTIDRHTGGLKKGSIWVVGARTGIGKTSFSTSIAASLLRSGKKVLLFSTEMDWIDAFGRFASIGTGISLHLITNARQDLTEEDQRKLGEYVGEIKSKPLYVIEEPEPSLRTVSEEVSRIQPDVFIFDHIQRVANSRDQRYLELAKFIKGLNTLCRQNNCAGIVNSQLNRLADHETPALHHLKECGALEEEANTVILLSILAGSANLSDSIILADIAKNRGPKGRVELRLDSNTAEFKEMSYEA